MEISQRTSLCSYLYLKIKCHVFYLFLFFSYKIGEQEGRTSPAQEGGLAPVGGVNTVQKNDTYQNYIRNWEGE
jgi:hypothetical protein